jgi:phosphatidylglycerol:prolipoprotein diacylglycerol transferase
VLPVLFKLPGTQFYVYSYSVAFGLAIFSAVYLTSRLAEEDGVPSKRIYLMAWSEIPGSVVAAKLVGAALLTAGPIGVPTIVHGPLYCLVAFAIGAVLFTVEVKLRRLPWLAIADAAAPGCALAAGVGRVGCFAAGCCWGRPTASSLGVSFGADAHRVSGTPIGIPLMPTQVIEALACLAAGLWILHLRNKRVFHGQMALAFMILYALERFVVEFWRDDPRASVGALSLSQVLSLVILVLAVPCYWFLRSRKDRQVGTVSTGSSGLSRPGHQQNHR